MKFNIGDKVMIDDIYLPITDNWLGEGNRVKHQGPFIIEKIGERCIRKMSGIDVCLHLDRFVLYNYEIY